MDQTALANDLNVPDNLFLGREITKFNWLGPFRILDYKSMRDATMAGLVKTGVKIPNIKNTIAISIKLHHHCLQIRIVALKVHRFHQRLDFRRR